MTVRIDHIAISCTDLAEARAWLESVLGAEMSAEGKHPAMGTHNRLLSLGDSAYLELIAVDPDATPPGRPRWFDLDHFSGPPRPTNWILRCDDIGTALARAPGGAGVPMALTRGPYDWRIAVPEDGRLPFDNLFPALIEWQGPRHPAPDLPDQGLRLRSLRLRHPRADALRASLARLGHPDIDLQVDEGAPHMSVTLETPTGPRKI
jgi:catechol 2,3-dioxygenase-like lactoylglutathione lyase family enzyme